MTLRSLFLSLLALTLFFIPGRSARAQASVYGSASLTNYGFFKNNDSAVKSDTAGVIGGLFYNFPIQSRLTAGIDARVSTGFGARGGALAAAALRIGFVPERVIFRPYFELGGGVVTSAVSDSQITGPVTQGLTAQSTRFTNGAVEFAGGLDIRVTDSFDVRAVELGAAALASNANTTTVGSAFLDAGVVYHFHRHMPHR